MITSVYTDCESAVKAALSPIIPLTGKAKSDWDYISSGSSFHGFGGTKGVADEFYGDHSYESKITCDMETCLISSTMNNPKWIFRNRQSNGCRADISLAMEAPDRCWMSLRREYRPSTAVRIFAPMGGIGDITAKQMAVCGALTCAVCELLERNGYSVEIWASCIAEGCSLDEDANKVFTLIKIKNSSQYTNYGLVNYICGNSHFYRNIIFKDRIRNICEKGFRYFGVGGSYNVREDMIPKEENTFIDIIIPRIYSLPKAKEWIEKEMMKIFVSGERE